MISPGTVTLATMLHEAGMGHNDLHKRIDQAIKAKHPGDYTSLVDVSGDDSAGEAVYSKGYSDRGPLKKAKYAVGGAGALDVDCDNATDCMPQTSYPDIPDDSAQYTAMAESQNLYQTGQVPLFERFISKGERDKADEGDFAGKGKSFPILKATDVRAALSSIGRAGSDNHSAAKLKANILAIAKRKGFAVPASDATEAARVATGGLRLFESATALETIVIREARADYEIKLIAPGKGSSAFYPKEVLQRDGPKVFKAGMHVYVNHPTLAEEAARPEGDVKNLAGVLSTDAYWSESHAKGPGLYGRMKVFADHGQMVEEKAPHVGMSIRASGVAESDKKRDGLPVLKELTSAESVDVVTRAGAGGMILTEAARTAANEGDAMTEQEATQLRESNTKLRADIAAQAAIGARLLERAIKVDARDVAAETLKDLSLAEVGKQRVIETALRNVPLKNGDLDRAVFVEAVKAEAKREGAYVASLGTGGRVIGMGAAPVELTEAQKTEAEAKAKRDTDRSVSIFESLGMPKDAAVFAAKGRAA